MNSDLDLKDFIRDIPDFPKPGILFRDITPLLRAPQAFRAVIDRLADRYRDSRLNCILAAEARGFSFAAPLALELVVSFILIRKPGNLPFDTQAFHYELEYGTDSLEMHIDAISKGDRVLLLDDLLATGGTMQACIRLAEGSDAEVVSCAHVIELDDLGGRAKLAPYECFSLIHY